MKVQTLAPEHREAAPGTAGENDPVTRRIVAANSWHFAAAGQDSSL